MSNIKHSNRDGLEAEDFLARKALFVAMARAMRFSPGQLLRLGDAFCDLSAERQADAARSARTETPSAGAKLHARVLAFSPAR